MLKKVDPHQNVYDNRWMYVGMGQLCVQGLYMSAGSDYCDKMFHVS